MFTVIMIFCKVEMGIKSASHKFFETSCIEDFRMEKDFRAANKSRMKVKAAKKKLLASYQF